MLFRLPNITGSIGSMQTGVYDSHPDFSGVFSFTDYSLDSAIQGNGWCRGQLNFNAHDSNSVYQDNGKVLPLSISKQSYIIYK